MINNVTLTGRLTKDPEFRYTPKGVPVVNFTLAVKKRFPEDNQPDADFIRCVALFGTAETIAKYVVKGSLIGVEGHISTRSFENDKKDMVYITEVFVENMSFLENKKEKDPLPDPPPVRKNSHQTNYKR